MKDEELTEYRIQELETKFKLLVDWQQTVIKQISELTFTLENLNNHFSENSKWLRGILSGVILLIITTIAAKIF